MKHHHGLHAFFNHCISNPNMADIYSVASQVFKQLDVAGDESSIHWIDIMDTHHPVKNSILPAGVDSILADLPKTKIPMITNSSKQHAELNPAPMGVESWLSLIF